jgi:hypothetical protein
VGGGGGGHREAGAVYSWFLIVSRDWSPPPASLLVMQDGATHNPLGH